MKPLLAVAIHEAVKLALIDSWIVDNDALTDEQKQQAYWDIHTLPGCDFDPVALMQNVACRLLGRGGWVANGVYAGKANSRQILDSCILRPDADPLGDLKMWLKSNGFEEGGEG